jgi:hypothetical protein
VLCLSASLGGTTFQETAEDAALALQTALQLLDGVIGVRGKGRLSRWNGRSDPPLALQHHQESSMSKAQPVPPASRSDKGPNEPEKTGDLARAQHRPEKGNLAEQGRQGNIRQNTHNQGYQQDR